MTLNYTMTDAEYAAFHMNHAEWWSGNRSASYEDYLPLPLPTRKVRRCWSSNPNLLPANEDYS